jgi:hypothetical protein
VDPKKIEAIQYWPHPKTLKSLRRFLCLTGYYCKFVKNYGKIATPLTALLKKNSFTWTPVAAQAFQTLKMAMCTTPVLALPDFTKTFVLECDASRKGIIIVLMQEGQTLAFTNKKLSKRNLGKPIYENEMLVILHVADLWHPYLLGQCFQIKTDHQSLKYFLEQLISSQEQQKWVTQLPPSPTSYIKGCSKVQAVDQLLQHRATMLAHLRENLHQAQNRMKQQVDQHRSERQFQEGDQVFLRLQPYKQTSLKDKGCQKLSPKFYGPYQVLQRIGEVAYKLALPPTAKIHPVFHVSCLKKVIGNNCRIQTSLPELDEEGSIWLQPEQVLDTRDKAPAWPHD